jgi:hypothetical protein
VALRKLFERQMLRKLSLGSLAASAVVLLSISTFAQVSPTSDTMTINRTVSEISQIETSEPVATSFGSLPLLSSLSIIPFLNDTGGLTVVVEPGSNGAPLLSQSAITALNGAGLRVSDLQTTSATLTTALTSAGITVGNLSDAFGVTGGTPGTPFFWHLGFVSDIEGSLNIGSTGIATQPLTFVNEPSGPISANNFLSGSAISAGYRVSFSSDLEAPAAGTSDTMTLNRIVSEISQVETSEPAAASFNSLPLLSTLSIVPFLNETGGLTVVVEPGSNGAPLLSQSAIAALNAAGLTVLDLQTADAALMTALASAGITLANLSDAFGVTSGTPGFPFFWHLGFVSNTEGTLNIGSTGIATQPLTFLNETSGPISANNFLSGSALSAQYTLSFTSDVETPVNVPDAGATFLLLSFGLTGIAMLHPKLAHLSVV